jgi:hypothetical protein
VLDNRGAETQYLRSLVVIAGRNEISVGEEKGGYVGIAGDYGFELGRGILVSKPQIAHIEHELRIDNRISVDKQLMFDRIILRIAVGNKMKRGPLIKPERDDETDQNKSSFHEPGYNKKVPLVAFVRQPPSLGLASAAQL